MFLDDGAGNGKKAKVDSDNRLHVRSFDVSQQHGISSQNKEAYQVSATKAIAASEIKVLLLKNTHNTKDLIVSYIQLETIGAATSNASAFWKIYVGGDYASGGTATVPTNMSVGSANAAQGVFYDATASTIVTSGTPVEIDRTYVANARVSYNKEGALILPKNASIQISWTGSTAAGTMAAQVSFYYDLVES
jgi:hypothetical protein